MRTREAKNVLAYSCAALLLSACATVPNATQGAAAFPGTSKADYERLGLTPAAVQPWEDGRRTSGAKGTYEWWYFDATLADGSTLVITFDTKNIARPDTAMAPYVSFKLDRPDGTKIEKDLPFPASSFSASDSTCDVTMGPNYFRGDLHDYTIHVEGEGLAADVKLHGNVPPWRPATGYIFFEDKSEHYFAWLPSVPYGDVTGSLSIAGRTEAIHGVGYHDHNWGDISLLALIHDWYWGRAQIGDYSLIASYIVSADKYGRKAFPIFLLARDGKILADDSRKVSFSTSGVYYDSYTKKPVAAKVVYDYNDGENHYRVTFERETDLLKTRFIDQLTGVEGIVARLAGFDSSYQRFVGSATLEKLEGDKVVETVRRRAAVWELMYFGKPPAR